MKSKRMLFLLVPILALLTLGIMISCDAFNPLLHGYPTVRWWGGEVGYGRTAYREITVGQAPYTEDFQIKMEGGDKEFSVRSIGDVTDRDDPSWHTGKMVISHANECCSFDIAGGGTYPFTITLQAPVVAGTTYEIEVGIQNNEGVLPNPYIFRFRVKVNP